MPPNPKFNEQLKRKLVAQLWYYGVHDNRGNRYDDDWRPLHSLQKAAKDAIKAGKVIRPI